MGFDFSKLFDFFNKLRMKNYNKFIVVFIFSCITIIKFNFFNILKILQLQDFMNSNYKYYIEFLFIIFGILSLVSIILIFFDIIKGFFSFFKKSKTKIKDLFIFVFIVIPFFLFYIILSFIKICEEIIYIIFLISLYPFCFISHKIMREDNYQKVANKAFNCSKKIIKKYPIAEKIFNKIYRIK